MTAMYAVPPQSRKIRTPGLSVLTCFSAFRYSLVASLATFLSFGALFVSPNLEAATVPVGFAETVVPGPGGGNWSEAVGVQFEGNGRMYVWERSGRVWFREPGETAFTQLLDLGEEVGAWEDHGLVGFALHPDFRQNGYLYLLYVVDRHHLLNFGTGSYNPAANAYNEATIGRLTRYTCRSGDGFRTVDPASRAVLIGATKETGIPMCNYSHGVGSLVFGTDGTLLISTGDGASPNGVDTGGGALGSSTYAPQALADGIIRPKEDVGAYRSQLVDGLNGKILRIDPATGQGLASNPFYDGAAPSAPRSRVWALGLRNPFRMSLRPGTGSHNPADGDPGVLYIGDVGWNDWEALKVVTGPGQNFGWPVYEGLSVLSLYANEAVANLDAPNPLYPGSGCSPYFSFRDLLREDSLAPADQPPFRNPCDASAFIPSGIPQFLHARPVLDWNHYSAVTRTPTYDGGGQATVANVGAAGSPVSGTPFFGNCAAGGAWYSGSAFPVPYRDSYYLAEWGEGVIKQLKFDGSDRPLSVTDFLSGGGFITSVAEDPTDGSLYYSTFDYSSSVVRKLAYFGNRTPVAAATADAHYGTSPLTVQFSSFGSSDPDGQALGYLWDFGDGTTSTAPNPSHTFTAPAGVPTGFPVTLTVTDTGGLSAQAGLLIGVNDSPPQVTITSPVDGSLYDPALGATLNLAADVVDAESADGELVYQWQTLLQHNSHNHGSPPDTNHVTTAVIAPTECDGINIYYYKVRLTVTDPTGLSTTREVNLFPDCGPNTAPTISGIAGATVYEGQATAPLAFTVGDNEMAPGNLQLTAASSDPFLVPEGNITFGGSGSNRTVTARSTVGLTGTATITVTVSDGPLSTSTAFSVNVNPPPAGTLTFTNTFPVTIPDQGAGSPYPSVINVTGLGGTITEATVQLTGFSHTWPADVDLLLVSPAGQALLLMSDAGTGPTGNATLTFADTATASLPPSGVIATGSYKPTNYDTTTDTFAGPAPGGPYAGTLSAFNGQGAVGAWSLYVRDDGPGDSGNIGSWSLTLTTEGGGPAAPTISDIADQSVPVNTGTGPIGFTVGDAETPAGNLTLSGSSSNPVLVPDGNIVFGGSGASRTVTVSPAAGQTGTATITVSVSDGALSGSDSFVLTVTAPNTAPTISDIADQTTPEDTELGHVDFVVGDAETASAALVVTAASSNPALVPAGNIQLETHADHRSLSITPAPDQSGTATITVSVSDGQLSASDSFVLTVTPVNDPPTIGDIPNQSIPVNTSTGAIAFTVGDLDTPVGSLTLSGSSSNPALVPNGNLVFGGSGASRTVTVSPVAGQTGTSTITVSVSDGALSASDSFVLTVSAESPLAYAQSRGTFADASGTALTVQLTNVQAGSLVVAYVKWEGPAGATVSLGDGSSAFTADPLNSAANGDLHGRFYYLPAAVATGTVNYTATWSAGRPYRKLMLYEYRYGGTVSVDGTSRATGTSGNLASGSITTTGGDGVVFGAYGEYGPNNTANEQLGGVAADQVLRSSYASMWSRKLGGPMTGGATATGNSSTWIGNTIAFKRNGSAGPASTALPGGFSLNAVGMGASDAFELEFRGERSKEYVIEKSMNLIDWEFLESFTFDGTPRVLSDPSSKGIQRGFYRATELPAKSVKSPGN